MDKKEKKHVSIRHTLFFNHFQIVDTYFPEVCETQITIIVLIAKAQIRFVQHKMLFLPTNEHTLESNGNGKRR